jgi:hypothetical protein
MHSKHGLFGTKECKTEKRKKTQECGIRAMGKQRNGKTQKNVDRGV